MILHCPVQGVLWGSFFEEIPPLSPVFLEPRSRGRRPFARVEVWMLSAFENREGSKCLSSFVSLPFPLTSEDILDLVFGSRGLYSLCRYGRMILLNESFVVYSIVRIRRERKIRRRGDSSNPVFVLEKGLITDVCSKKTKFVCMVSE